MAKRLTKQEGEMYSDFAETFQYCWACFSVPRSLADGFRLEIAHICGGSGRSADRRNITRLCAQCHRLNHGHTIKEAGIRLPHLDLGHLLTLKLEFDPFYYDSVYLISRMIRNRLPEFEVLPEYFLERRVMNGKP